MKLFENHLSTATKMLDILKGIEAEMDASLSPNNRAMQSLGVDSFGCCSEIYTKDAEELWTKQLTLHPNDPDTIHHLSILHHARAFDIEFSNDPTKADADWEKSFKYWQKLIRNDEFWNHISLELGGNYVSHVGKARERLPERLLSIHFSIAYSPSTAPHRAKYHIRHALQAGFPVETLEVVRVSTYERFTSDLPDEVWGGNLAEQSLLKGACDKIRRILEVDPECIAALHDVIRIQKRLLTMQLHLIAEHQDDDAQVLKIRKELRDQANEWAPYFELLLLDQESMPDDVRENLLYWLQWMGDIKTRLKDYPGAIEHYDKGTLICSNDDSACKELLKSAALFHALYARDLADQKSSSAKAECKKASIRSGHSALSQYFLAQAYQTLKDYETALIACDRGISLVDEDASDNASSRADMEMARERLHGLKKQLELDKVFHAAQIAMEKKDFKLAIKVLTDAINAGHENSYIYFFRCQCNIAIKNVSAAKEDLTKFEVLAKANEEREAAGRLRQQIQDIDLGDKYLEPAKKAIDSKDFKKAIALYSKAVDAGHGDFYVYCMRCQCYAMDNKYDAAVADLKKCEVIAKNPEEKKAVQDFKKQLLPDAPKDDASVTKLADEIYDQISSSVPNGIELKNQVCKNKLKQIIKDEGKKWNRESKGLVANKLVEAINQDPRTYCRV